MSLCCSPLHSTRTPDSAWSWLVCFSGCLSLALVFGTLQCFAVVMPVLMDYFDETRTKTGKKNKKQNCCCYKTQIIQFHTHFDRT